MLYKDLLIKYNLDINTQAIRIIIENNQRKYIIKREEKYYIISDLLFDEYEYIPKVSTEKKTTKKTTKKTAKKKTTKKKTAKKSTKKQ